MTAATAKSKHRFRDNVDAFAIAILMAILFKFFAIEAYQIPTSSMQPTMMGSKAAGVYDRILVDKTRYLITDPERWDIAVFRYPIRVRQNYVKRIVGMPGDRLLIAGGNVYQVAPGGDPSDPAALTVLPRPEAVQEQHWKEIFPARLSVGAPTRALDGALSARGGNWTEGEEGLVVEPRSQRTSAILAYPGPRGQGLVNLVWDGYPPWIAEAMQEAGEMSNEEAVQDARVSFSVEPTARLDELAVRLTVTPANGPKLEFRLTVEDGQGRIVVEKDGKEAAATETFPVELIAGRSTEVRFTHLDDRCVAEIDGEEVPALDCSEFKTLDPIFPRQGAAGTDLRIEVRSAGRVRIGGLRIERDLHYLPSMTAQREGRIDMIEVPQSHYFMMGDNTLQSVDSRDWTAITVGRLQDALVDPATHPDAQRIAGNMRAIELGEMPDPDENPVVVPSENGIVFTDRLGEVYALEGEVALDADAGKVWGPSSLWFVGEDAEFWEPERHQIRFVPRDHIIGRPLVTFWPLFSPFRLGFIR